MKLAPREIRGFLAAPPAKIAAVLIYGPDAGLMRERAEGLVRQIAGATDDPFRVTEMSGGQLREDPARLVDEVFALSFTGGRRAIRIRNAQDSHTEIFESFFAEIAGRKASDIGFVVVEGGDLASRSSLRSLFEEQAIAAAIPCYLDSPEELESLVRATLKERGISIEEDALAYFIDRIGEDRGASRSEVDKLTLYAEGEGEIVLADVQALVGAGGNVGFDDASLSAATGDAPSLDRALTLLYDEGTSPIAVLRGAQRVFQRLHIATSKVAEGTDVESALKSLRPPVFFKEMSRWKSAVQAWSPRNVAGALDILMRAEADCKTTGLPANAIAARALLHIAAAARRARR
ncbi:MAG TPA: DNA polymerase III subunit delta [Alphaproteobacteria bacterium]|nr:DNA polymerase III subunit delta [Alphaproteobacteria bacterium]